MIHSIEITGFRGIRQGRLEELGKLTVLTGPNGCGKSAVLDALLVGTRADVANAAGDAVCRHPAEALAV